MQTVIKETIMAQSSVTPAVFSNGHYHLTEDSHTAIYQARHLLGLLYDMSSTKEEFCEVHLEHLAVSLGVITDLMDSVFPGLIFDPRGVRK